MRKSPPRQCRDTFTATPDDAGVRLDLFLCARLPQVSRKAVKRALDGGQVFVDGRCERRASRPLQAGEAVRITVAVATSPPPPAELTILYRDDQLLAVNKPAGMAAHRGHSDRPDALTTVTGWLREEGQGAPILLHRLDVDTSGVLLFALDGTANRELSRQFAEREVEKTYLALVTGEPPNVFRVDNYLKPKVRGRTAAVLAGGQPAQTDFRTLARSQGIALVEARPHTGRTHQIRVHLADRGYPLLGDRLYGGVGEVELGGVRHRLNRHLLHAWRLACRHPRSGMPLLLEAPLPEAFLALGLVPQ